MNSIKCPNCGLANWADAETCKRCQQPIVGSDQFQNFHSSESHSDELSSPELGSNDFPHLTPNIETVNVASRRRFKTPVIVAFMVTIFLAGLTTFFVVYARGGETRTFGLKEGKRTSKIWFHSWFTTEPSVEQIFAQYRKVSGHPETGSAITNFTAKARFEVKNGKEGRDQTTYAVTSQGDVVHVHWESYEGNVEFQAESPNKFFFTQQFDDRSRLIRCGTNGTNGWWQQNGARPLTPLNVTNVNGTQTGDWGIEQITDLQRGGNFINYLQLQNPNEDLYIHGHALVGDRVAYELYSHNISGSFTAMYFDVETGMLLKFATYRHSQPYNPATDGYVSTMGEGFNGDAEVYLEDYRDVNGVKIPFLIRQKYQDLWLVTRVTEVNTNTAVDKSVFEKPSA